MELVKPPPGAARPKPWSTTSEEAAVVEESWTVSLPSTSHLNPVQVLLTRHRHLSCRNRRYCQGPITRVRLSWPRPGVRSTVAEGSSTSSVSPKSRRDAVDCWADCDRSLSSPPFHGRGKYRRLTHGTLLLSVKRSMHTTRPQRLQQYAGSSARAYLAQRNGLLT